MRFGERLRDEAQAQLERVSDEIAHGEPWQSVAERLRQEVPSRDQAVSEFSQAMRAAREFTESRQLVCIPPGGLSVVPTPPFLRELVPIAAYQGPGALDEAQDGTFFVTMPPPEGKWRGPCLAELPATALHEGIPGDIICRTSPRTGVIGWCVACPARRRRARGGRSTAS
jgi:uncharacterized protein (DUF885 family)